MFWGMLHLSSHGKTAGLGTGWRVLGHDHAGAAFAGWLELEQAWARAVPECTIPGCPGRMADAGVDTGREQSGMTLTGWL